MATYGYSYLQITLLNTLININTKMSFNTIDVIFVENAIKTKCNTAPEYEYSSLENPRVLKSKRKMPLHNIKTSILGENMISGDEQQLQIILKKHPPNF
jgi:hypothetical protein